MQAPGGARAVKGSKVAKPGKEVTMLKVSSNTWSPKLPYTQSLAVLFNVASAVKPPAYFFPGLRQHSGGFRRVGFESFYKDFHATDVAS